MFVELDPEQHLCIFKDPRPFKQFYWHCFFLPFISTLEIFTKSHSHQRWYDKPLVCASFYYLSQNNKIGTVTCVFKTLSNNETKGSVSVISRSHFSRVRAYVKNKKEDSSKIFKNSFHSYLLQYELHTFLVPFWLVYEIYSYELLAII